jgi:EsV-1-7 cysteine-rich motif
MTRYCIAPGCTTYTSFGNQIEGRNWCFKHKLPSHENMTKIKCNWPGCQLSATFGPVGAKRGSRCSHHKKPSYVGIGRPQCHQAECKLSPSFGYYGNQPTHCHAHRLRDQIGLIVSRKRRLTREIFGIREEIEKYNGEYVETDVDSDSSSEVEPSVSKSRRVEPSVSKSRRVEPANVPCERCAVGGICFACVEPANVPCERCVAGEICFAC